MSILSCNDEVSRECTNCPVYEPNRIIHVALVKKNYFTNITDTLWRLGTSTYRATALLEAELSCNAIIFRNVNGTKPDPTKSELPGRGKQPSQTGRTTHTVAIQDFDYIANQENGFYNALEANAGLYDFYYMTENYVFQVTDTFLKIAAFDPITDDNSTNIIGRVDVMWQQKGNPIAYGIDTDSFDGCQILATADIAFDVASLCIIEIVNESITIGAACEAIFTFSYPNLTTLVLSSVDALPTGVTLVNNTMVFAGTQAAGDYTLALTVTNSCGSVSGEITLSVTVTA